MKWAWTLSPPLAQALEQLSDGSRLQSLLTCAGFELAASEMEKASVYNQP